MNKKSEARMAMLKAFSKEKSSELHEPSVGKKLSEKKFSKVSSEEPKKLSKAQMILKAKLGEKLLGKEEEEESEEECCPECEGAGCEVCEEESDEEEEESDEE